MNDDTRGTVIGLSAMALCIIVGAAMAASAYADVGDDCMIPRGFLAWVAGAAGAVAGGGIGFVLACILSLTDAVARLNSVSNGCSGRPIAASATLMRPVEQSAGNETLLRPFEVSVRSDDLLRPVGC